MSDISTIAVALAGLVGIAILSLAGLTGWRGWLELQKSALGHESAGLAAPPAAARIELADLKERVRKLEAIAAGIDL